MDYSPSLGRRVSRVADRPWARLSTRSGVPPSVSSSSWWVIGRRSWRVSRVPSPRGRLRLVAQVGGLYLGVVQERRGRALEGEVRVLLDEERRHALGPELTDHLEEVLHDEGRETGGRFVEQDEVRLRHQRAADREHLLLTAAERNRELSRALGEPREQRVDALQPRGD